MLDVPIVNAPQAEDAETSQLARTSTSFPLSATLKVLGDTPTTFTLAAGRCIVGTGRGADFVIAGDSVSRKHAELELVPEGVRVTDLNSRNGTFYLGQRIGELTVALGSRLRLGSVELAIEASRDALGKLPRSQATQYQGLIGSSPRMRHLFAMLQRLEGSLVTVLLEGESGTGKEVAARALHERSLVAQGPFVAVNCGSLDRSLVRSELFGHVRGAFTGATEARRGAFELASTGTLFLDEVGELPLDVQPVLLRALESSMISRVGESIDRPVGARVVAATNRDLKAMAAAGTFREDLYYRLAIVKLQLPPLRERREDLCLLVQHIAHDLGMAEVPASLLTDFGAREWPGNVRELKNALRAFVALGDLPSGELGSADRFEERLRDCVDIAVPYANLKERLVSTFFRLYIEKMLAHTGGNQTEAARISGLERSYFSKAVRRLGSNPS